MAEFCTTHREEELQTYLDNAWAVHDAPQRALASAGGRVGKLRDAAAAGACTCGGVWTAGVTFVLQYQGDDAPRFCHDVLRALTLGAARGVNMAVVGPPGCGKSTVFEDLNLIFNTSGKPVRDSCFPLSGILGTDVLLLQEFSWSAKICAFEELLQMLAGERLAVRVPCARPVQHRITASMFYTAWAPLGVTGMDASRPYNLNTAVAERFTTRTWARPHPP